MLRQWLDSYMRECFRWSLVMAVLSVALDFVVRGQARAVASASGTLLGLIGGAALGHALLWWAKRRRRGRDRQTA